METLCILYVGGGLLLTLLAVPMIAGKVPPNPIYGFRTPATLSDPDLWYAVNRRAGWWFLAGGLVNAIAALVLYQIPGLSVDAYALLVLAVIVIGLAAGIGDSFRYLCLLKRQ
jgi:uncharacterized membrane protein